MPPFSMHKLPDEAIIICTLDAEWKASSDAPLWAGAVYEMLQCTKHPAYLIVDLDSAPIDVHEMIVIANEAARGYYAFTNHRNLRGLLLVSSNSMIALAAQGMKTEIFGFAPVSAYNSLEDALEAARARLNGSY